MSLLKDAGYGALPTLMRILTNRPLLMPCFRNGKGRRKVYSIDVPEEVLDFNEKKKRAVMKKASLILSAPPMNLVCFVICLTLTCNAHTDQAGIAI